jgi:hypothetical protein
MDILCGFSVQPSQLNSKREQIRVSEVVFFISLIFDEVGIYFDIDALLN